MLRPVRTAALLGTALIHLLPFIGVLGAARLEALYGVPVADPNLEILLRHRAVLFGLLGAFLLVAPFRRGLAGPALAAGAISVGSFLLLAGVVGEANAQVSRVVAADVVAAVLLAVGAAAHVRLRRVGIG